MDIFEEFLELHAKTDRACFRSHPRAEDAELECVIVEPRHDPRLRGVLMNFSATFPYAALTICCSLANLDFVKGIVAPSNEEPNNVRVIAICKANITRDEYTALLMATEFWELLVTEKILIFQIDTGVRYNNVLEYMQYDYIGAPWPWMPDGMKVGNGGLSLRSRKWMIYITRRFGGDSALDAEDLFFSHHLRYCVDAVLPSVDVATTFSIEYSSHPNPMGFHQFYLYHDRDYVRSLLTYSSPDRCCLTDIREAWIESANGDRYYHPRLVGWLRLGISRRDGFRFSSRTHIPFAHDFAPGVPKRLIILFADGSMTCHEMHSVIHGQ